MNSAKMAVRLTRDEDGYPPIEVERVWVEMQDDGTAVVDNIPFFCREFALGDTVQATTTDGELFFEKVLERSGNSTIGDFEGALERSVLLKPASDALWEIGFVHRHRGNLLDAIASYEKAYEMDPENCAGLDAIAEMKAELGKSE